MPLQNRVDPFGEIHAVEWRGMFTGNRGVIHDPDTKTLLGRRWTTKAWIVCACQYKGRRREPMGRNAPSSNAGWTELFFLDEVTALAAGHRPCFYCRREQAKEFVRCYGEAFGVANARVGEIDERLHAERLASGGLGGGFTPQGVNALPDGDVIADGSKAYAVREGVALRWSFAGYQEAVALAGLLGRPLRALTPPTTLAVLRAGYKPVWHPTIGP